MSLARAVAGSDPASGIGRYRPGYVTLVYALVLVWGLGDVGSTYFVVAATGSTVAEVNPLIRLMLDTEPLLVLALKAGVVLYAGVVLLACRDVVRRVPGWRIWFGGLVSAGLLVVCNNALVGLSALA